jgi:hypothetical protein
MAHSGHSLRRNAMSLLRAKRPLINCGPSI